MKDSKDYNNLPFKFILCLLVSLLTLSCQNFIINNKTSCTVALNDEIKDVIARSSNFTDDTVFLVQGILYKEDQVAVKLEDNSTLNNLNNVSFNFTDIPFGVDYKIQINLIKDNDCIYQATSDKIALTEDNPVLVLDLTVAPVIKHIKYELNGGSFNTNKPDTYSIMNSVYLVDPVLENFEFLGWYATEDFSGEKIQVLNKDNYYGDITLYAAWRGYDTLPAPTFSHKGNNISGSSYELDKGDTIIINNSFDKSSKVYYTVNGSTPNSINGTLYKPNTPIHITENQTIKAITMEDGFISSSVVSLDVKIKSYEVRYDNGGHGMTPNSPGLKTKGESITLPSGLTEPTYNFTHWDVGGIAKNPLETITIDEALISKAVNGVITIKACWEGVVEDVTFSVTGTVDKGDKVTLACATQGATIYYTTNGQSPNTSSDVYTTPLIINNNQTLKAIGVKSGMKDSNVTSADYNVKTYTVTFDANGHGIAPSPISGLMKGECIDIPQELTDPTSGFSCTQEWYKEKECINKWNFNSSTIISNITLYAKWTDIPPSPISNFTAGLDASKTKIVLNWDNPTESDIDKIQINGSEANYSQLIVKNGKNQNSSITLDSGNIGKGTYNFTAVVSDKGNNHSTEVNCSIELPIFDDFSIPNGRENSKYSVYVTGKNFTKNNLQSSDFTLEATSNSIVPTNLVIDSDTELHFDIPSSTAKTDEITISVVGAISKKANVEIKTMYNISDIVMTDGSILTSEKLTNYRGKAKPVAIIFREKTSSLPSLGVGLYAKRCYNWSSEIKDLNGINDNSDSDTDGRDNWGIVQKADPTGASNAATNYPAFDFSNNYGSTYYSGTSFESNWYLPTTREIMLLADSIPTYNALSDEVIQKFPLKPDQLKFGQATNCWSSTQNGADNVNTYWFPHQTKRSEQKQKNGNTEGLCAIAMRPFD